MGAHNNPDGNCEPLAADGMERDEGIQNASQSIDPNIITTERSVPRRKKEFVIRE